LCVGSMAQATTYYVATTGHDDTGNGSQAAPFQTIRKGLDTAQNGDTVLVAAGTYTGDDNRNLSFNGRNLTLSSQSGPAATIIDCQGNQDFPARGFLFSNGETNEAVLDGFTIQNGYADSLFGSIAGGGIAIKGACPTIRNCVVWNNAAILD